MSKEKLLAAKVSEEYHAEAREAMRMLKTTISARIKAVMDKDIKRAAKMMGGEE